MTNQDNPRKIGDQGIVVDVETSKEGCIGVDFGDGRDLTANIGSKSRRDAVESSGTDGDDDYESDDDGENAAPAAEESENPTRGADV